MRRLILFASLAGAALLPGVVRAQQPQKAPQIGFLSLVSDANSNRKVEFLKAGLRELGYVEGRNVHIEYRYADGDTDRLPGLAAELVARKVDVIVTFATGVLAARQATDTIPIVQAIGADPVSLGLAKSLSHPGGNLTGASYFTYELMAKRLEFLRHVNPALARVGVLLRRGAAPNGGVLQAMGSTAAALGVELFASEVRQPSEFAATLSAWREAGVEGSVVVDQPVFILRDNARQLTALGVRQRNRLPTISVYRSFGADGGLMAYGPDANEIFRRSASYVDRILKGASPAGLPLQQPDKFEFVVNLKTAKALGLIAPQSILAAADEFIE